MLHKLYRTTFYSIELCYVTAAQNPGYIHVKYLNLRKRRAQVFNCPSRKLRHQPINFTFRAGNVTVDMVNGELNIDKVLVIAFPDHFVTTVSN